MAERVPRITGTGYAVPSKIRTNEDPIFQWLKDHPPPQNPFTGYVDRHILSDSEDLMTIMVPAAKQALEAADLEPSQVDMLLGVGSISPWWNPNELCQLHKELGLPRRTWTVPLNNEFSNFNAALLFADALVRTGRIGNALLVAGGNWTRHVDYHTPQSVSAADGAGAAVVAVSDDESLWTVVDHETITDTEFYGSMFMQGYQNGDLWSNPVFQITEEGLKGFGAFGVKTAPDAVLNILSRQNLKGGDIVLIGHQASQVLYDNWVQVIKPSQLVETIKEYANMTVAAIAVNLAKATAENSFERDNLALLALGPDMHANAILLKRA